MLMMFDVQRLLWAADHLQRMPQGEDPEIDRLLTIKTTSLPMRP